MNDVLKSQIIEYLKNTNGSLIFNDNRDVEELVLYVDTSSICHDITTTSYGLEYYRDLAVAYLREQNMAVSALNLDRVARKFPVQSSEENQNIIIGEDGKKYFKLTKHISNISDITESLSDDELRDLMLLNLLKINKKSQVEYEYAVEVVKDTWKGSTNIDELNNILTKYGGLGFRVVSIFTNELGKNATSVSINGVTSGTNSTIDQIVIVFEKVKNND